VVRIEREESGWLGITAFAVGGLMAGVVLGAALGELLGPVSTERVRGALGRRRRDDDADPPDPRLLQRSVDAALAEDEGTSALEVSARALGDGIVELDGRVPTADDADHARDVVRAVAGVDVVVSHVAVDGDGAPTRDASAH
jgi:hypothetical protein